MTLPILETIGLTKREAEVYEILLKLGESPVIDIVKETKAHPQIVYRALEGLLSKELVTTSVRKYRKYFRAEDPRVLEKLEKERLETLRQTIPDLLELQKTSKESIVKIAKGEEAIRQLRRRGIEELGAGDEYLVIGASGDRFYKIMGDFFLKLEVKRLKKGIWRKNITFESQRKLVEKNEKGSRLVEFRYLPESFHIPSSTNIFNNTVAILVWAYDPIVIMIESKEIAESYRGYFKSLWKLAKK